MTTRARHFEADGLRAGALGLVAIDVETGRILALAGAISACSAKALQASTSDDATADRRALANGSRCARWPDRRSPWLAEQSPAVWMVPPGSSVKPLAVLAGISSGQLRTLDDDAWRHILAQSRDQQSIQALALRAGAAFPALLRDTGFADPVIDLMQGTGAEPGSSWRVTARGGVSGMQPSALSLAQVTEMRAQAMRGERLEKAWGADRVASFLQARRVMDSAVGGADMSVSALGLADTFRRLALRAEGRSSAGNAAPALRASA